MSQADTFSIPKNIDIITTGPGELELADELLLDDKGRLFLMPSAFYAEMPNDLLRAWCVKRGRYGIPTCELIDWLKAKIAGRKVIEVGAGCGDLGFHLGIPMTDSYQQVKDEVTADYLKTFGQAPTTPPSDVICEDAEMAVRRRKPQVVVASWLTQRYIAPKVVKYDGEGLALSPHGNIHGPREEYILERCDTYIFIGNETIHGEKRIMSIPHEKFYFPWLVSRSKTPQKNVIYVWERKR